MSTVRIRDAKLGGAVEFNGEVYLVFDKHEQTRGNLRTYWQVKLKHFERGNVIDQRFSPDDQLPTVYLERSDYECLYEEPDNYVFMHPTTYEQERLGKDMVTANDAKFLLPNLTVQLLKLNGTLSGLVMPQTIECEVIDAPPSEKGDTATKVTKIATIETGAEIKVPAHIKTGDVIKIRVESGEFAGRVNS
ncbi:MAG: elongation factor P [Simkania sp.]|nr:elongation factor P [Simkania sp.]